MELPAFIAMMEEVAPPALADEFDLGRIGLVVEAGEQAGTVCTALDATPAVVAGAIRSGADMLVVHHTPLWTPLTAVCGATAGLLGACLSAGLSIYVMHTNFDRAPGGVNDTLAERLGLSRTVPMSLGLVGDCALTPSDIARILGEPVRVWGRVDEIQRLAVVGGSGFDPALVQEAAAAGAAAFLSSEMKHAVARAAPLPCIEATHYGLEAPAMRALAARMGWEYCDDRPMIRDVPP